MDTGSTPARKPKKKTGTHSGTKTKRKLRSKLDTSIADLDQLLQDQEKWGPCFGRLSTIMERSTDFGGTFTINENILEECRVRCGKVSELLSFADSGNAENKENDSDDDAFVQAQEEAEQVKAFLDTVSGSLRATLETGDGAGGAEQEAADTLNSTLDRLNSVIAELALDEMDGFEEEEKE